MAFDTTTTIVGNLTRDPEITFGSSGKARVTFTLAVSQGKDDNKHTSFFDVTVFGQQAENAANTLKKGDRAVVFGALRQSTFERKDGTKGSSVELIADEVAPSLRWSTASIIPNERNPR